MDSGFNNPDGANSGADAPAAASSPAMQRFESCRWRKASEEGVPAHCTHRDVLPITGTAGFVPESWCADCAFYKAKRVPKKPQDNQDTWRRW